MPITNNYFDNDQTKLGSDSIGVLINPKYGSKTIIENQTIYVLEGNGAFIKTYKGSDFIFNNNKLIFIKEPLVPQKKRFYSRFMFLLTNNTKYLKEEWK